MAVQVGPPRWRSGNAVAAIIRDRSVIAKAIVRQRYLAAFSCSTTDVSQMELRRSWGIFMRLWLCLLYTSDAADEL